MGLSSSQGRLLMLTSRLSDIELQQMIISQRQNQLAWKEAESSKEYNEAMNNYKLIIKIPDEEGKRQDKDLTYSNMTSMGYLITDSNGKLCLERGPISGAEVLARLLFELEAEQDPEKRAELQAKFDEKKAVIEAAGEDYTEEGWIIPKDADGNDLFSIKGDNTAVFSNDDDDLVIVDGTSYLSNKTSLQNLLVNNVLFVKNSKDDSESFSPTSEILESNTDFEYVLDTSDDAAAESKHNYELALLSAKENQLEMDLAQLETQHEAVLKEYESVKELISSNVDRTFKLFSNG